MRIDRLALTAFGPFTEQEIDLSGGAPGGVHVVFGPNEAGKSTALRAVLALLFGIPTRTQDAHLHPYGKLRLGAQLRSGDRTLTFVRLKRRKDDLLDERGQPLDPAQLTELLAHLDEQTFTRRFGLDQTELELGAEALLGGGEEGLFAAGTAGATARQVLDSLTEQADELFLPRGKVKKLNRALSAFAEAQKHARKLVRPPEMWLEQKQAQEAAEQEAERLKQHRSSIRTEHTRLSRLSSLLSDLARLEQVDAQLVDLSNVPRLPADAPEQRQTLQRDLRDAQFNVEHFEEELQTALARLETLPTPSPLSDVADEHLALRDRLGRARSAREDHPKLVARRRALAETVARVLRGLGYDAPEDQVFERARRLLPNASHEKRILALLEERSALGKELELAQREVQAAADEAAEIPATEFEEPQSLDALAAVLADAHTQLATGPRLAELVETIAARGNAIATARERLGLATATQVATRLLPTAEEVRAGADRWRSLETHVQHAREEIDELAANAASTRARLTALRGRSELPSEQQLAEMRARRDHLVAQIGGGEGPERSDVAGAVRAADEVVDRLRHEASRVAEARGMEQTLAGLDARRQVKQQQLESARQQLLEHRKHLGQRIAVAKDSEATAFPDEQVPTVVAYQTRAGALLALAAQEQEQAQALAARDAVLGAQTQAAVTLRAAMTELGLEPIPPTAGLAGAVKFAEARLEEYRREQTQAQDRRKQLDRIAHRTRTAQRNLEAANQRLGSWEESFEQAATELSSGQQLTVARTRDVLTELSQLREVLSEARLLDNRIDGIERDARTFADDVRRLATRHAPELVERDPIDTGEQLLERIVASRRIAEERTQLAQAAEATRTRLREAQAAVQSARAQLEDLMRAADVTTVDALSEVEERSRRAVQLDAVKQELMSSLLEKSSGRPLDELRDEARGYGHHQLYARIEELAEELDELEEQTRDAEHRAAAYGEGLKRYGSEDVAWARQRTVALGAEARTLLREYLTVRTAKVVLQEQITRYADRFAGPIAQRASNLFARLTLGRYSRLRIGVGDQTIRLVRGTDEIEVDQLSRGTRAQLYLALRLASLETHFEHNPVVPLILDDLFVDFDDDRAQAAFEILGELAERVQVLYFTHLHRDVEAARRGVAHNLLFEHSIGA